MFVGHAALAFGVAALAARALGRDRETALLVGVVAGAFATVPDVDVLFALPGLAAAVGSSPLAMADAFWTSSTLVHRTITHSLVVAVPAATAFALWPAGRRAWLVAGGLVLTLLGVALVASGPLGAAVAAAFCLAGLAVGGWAARRGLGWRLTGATALFGLVSHPFGDVFTGTVPAFLYPLDLTLLQGRIAPFGDATLNLLLAFGVELACLWLGVLVFLWLTDRDVASQLAPRATVGAAYAVAILVVPAPTLDLSYPFVLSVLAVGVVGATPRLDDGLSLPGAVPAAVTGLTAVTLAGVAYLLAYLFLGAGALLA